MHGRIVLAGGDEFRPGCEEMDSYILRTSGKDPARVLIVPTAAVTGPQKAATDGVRYFSSLGALASGLMVLGPSQANEEKLLSAVSGVSLVYFTGGSPDHLLETLRGSKLFDRLLQECMNGAIIGGSSAGAMVMGSMMRRPSTAEWVPGLGVAEGLAVLPHHERSEPSAVAEELAATAPPGLTVLGIDARTCCVGSPGSWRVVGVGRVTAYRDGSWATYNSGDDLPPGV